jgi:hypothetical protein
MRVIDMLQPKPVYKLLELKCSVITLFPDR